MPISFVRAAIVLGLLSTVGPIAIDMYLPALPAMTTDLAATSAGTQLSLMAYFVAVAAFQPLYGPVSDMIGRRRPLFFGLLLYVAAGVRLRPVSMCWSPFASCRASAAAPAWSSPGQWCVISTPV